MSLEMSLENASNLLEPPENLGIEAFLEKDSIYSSRGSEIYDPYSNIYPKGEIESSDFFDKWYSEKGENFRIYDMPPEQKEALKDIISYAKVVDEAYGVENEPGGNYIADLGENIGGITDLITGNRAYNKRLLGDILNGGDLYKMVIQDEAFHKFQLKIAREMGIGPEELAAIAPILDGQAAYILRENIHEEEQKMYKEFLESDSPGSLYVVQVIEMEGGGKYAIYDGNYLVDEDYVCENIKGVKNIYEDKVYVNEPLMREYLLKVEEEAKNIDLHPEIYPEMKIPIKIPYVLSLN